MHCGENLECAHLLKNYTPEASNKYDSKYLDCGLL
jgi:hypothetical protein